MSGRRYRATSRAPRIDELRTAPVRRNCQRLSVSQREFATLFSNTPAILLIGIEVYRETCFAPSNPVRISGRISGLRLNFVSFGMYGDDFEEVLLQAVSAEVHIPFLPHASGSPFTHLSRKNRITDHSVEGLGYGFRVAVH